MRNKKAGILIAFVLAAFVSFSFVGERGFLRIYRMVQRRDGLRSRVKTLERKNIGLAGEIELLRSDPATIEGLARTKLGLVRPGEVVFVFPDEEKSEERLK
ncbi:MAG: septum formation initiator family protein [Deltaproteobacteria bacterium]|nr:septum formation initiator family protein [Deltaproteobacteria bacterium]